jgi:hypothetical protein
MSHEIRSLIYYLWTELTSHRGNIFLASFFEFCGHSPNWWPWNPYLPVFNVLACECECKSYGIFPEI